MRIGTGHAGSQPQFVMTSVCDLCANQGLTAAASDIRVYRAGILHPYASTGSMTVFVEQIVEVLETWSFEDSTTGSNDISATERKLVSMRGGVQSIII